MVLSLETAVIDKTDKKVKRSIDEYNKTQV